MDVHTFFSSPWRVVAACFLLQIYCVGNIYTSGLYLVDLIREFGVNEIESSMIGSLQTSIFYGIGLYTETI